MSVESRLQGKIVKWLKSKGCYVIVTTAITGVPTGCPDVIALFPGGGWAALEVKASEKSKFQPLQKPTIAKLDVMYYSKAVWPENWEQIKKELSAIL